MSRQIAYAQNHHLFTPRLLSATETRKIILSDIKVTAKKNTLRAYKDENSPKRQLFTDMCKYINLDIIVTCDKLNTFFVIYGVTRKGDKQSTEKN